MLRVTHKNIPSVGFALFPVQRFAVNNGNPPATAAPNPHVLTGGGC
jgi:hypothetical protein